MSNIVITSGDIVEIMLGRRLTIKDIITELEQKLNFSCDHRHKKLVRNVLDNMVRSKNAVIKVMEKQDEDMRVKYWHLLKVKDCYFRKCVMARKLNEHDRKSLEKIETLRKPKQPRVIRTVVDIHETNLCRLARAVDIAWRTGEFCAPELLTIKKYERKSKNTNHIDQ